MSKRILVIGEMCADLIVTGMERMPVLGEETMAEDFSIQVGGSSLITACGLAKLGIDTAFYGNLGTDSFGQNIRKQLEERGLDISRVRDCSPVRTGLSIALNVAGDRGFATYAGSITAGRYEHLPPDLFEGFDHLHMGSFFFLEEMKPARIVQDAKKAGLTVSLDTGFDPSESWGSGIREVLPEIDFFLVNEVEAPAIAGTSDIPSAVKVLSGLTPGLAVKLGSAGAVFAKDGRIWRADPAPDDGVVDTTGAGDSFNAGFLAGWALGSDCSDCLRLANACGACAVQVQGGIPGQPDLAQAEKIGANVNVQEQKLENWTGQ